MTNQTAALGTKRINAGIYYVATANGHFEVERFPDGAWMLFRVVLGECGAEQRDYMHDFMTKREAVAYAHSGNAWKAAA